MIAMGMGLTMAGYTIGLYGWILLRGNNISFQELFTAGWPPRNQTGYGPAHVAGP
jgi:hypothetical protein